MDNDDGAGCFLADAETNNISAAVSTLVTTVDRLLLAAVVPVDTNVVLDSIPVPTTLLLVRAAAAAVVVVTVGGGGAMMAVSTFVTTVDRACRVAVGVAVALALLLLSAAVLLLLLIFRAGDVGVVVLLATDPPSLDVRVAVAHDSNRCGDDCQVCVSKYLGTV
jgi:hypothetical protein